MYNIDNLCYNHVWGKRICTFVNIHTYTCYINCAKKKQTLCTACNKVECCASNGSHLNKLFEKRIVNYW